MEEKKVLVSGIGARRLEALRWLSVHGPVSWFGRDTPPLSTIKWLKKFGYVDTQSSTERLARFPMPMTAFVVSEKGRQLLHSATSAGGE